MPTTRSRALRSNNASAPEHPAAAPPALPPQVDCKKRKRSRLDTENVATTDPDGENDATVSPVTAVSAKKHKGSDKNLSQRKPLVKKPDMPPPPPPVTVKVVNPTPPEVSQKAMRSVGSVIAKFDPWKMRDSILGHSNNDLYDSEDPSDDTTKYDQDASTPDALQEDEPTAESEVSLDFNLDMPHSVGGADARQDKEVQAATNQDDDILDETATRFMGSALDGLRSVEGSMINNGPVMISNSDTEDDDVGKQDFSVSASGEPPELIVTEGGTYMTHVPPSAQGDENDPERSSERDVDQRERDTGANRKVPHFPPFSGDQIAESSNNGLFGDSPLNAEPLVAIQARSPSSGAQPDDDTDGVSSMHTEDAEGEFDEEFYGSVQFDWEERRAVEKAKDADTEGDGYIGTSVQRPADGCGDVLEDYADVSAYAVASQKPGVDGEGAYRDEFDGFSEITEVGQEPGATSGILNDNIDGIAHKDNDEYSKHVNAVEAQRDEEPASNPEEDVDRTSSVGDGDGAITPFSIELDCLSDEKTEESGESSDDGQSDLLDHDDVERATPDHDEAALEGHRMFKASTREGDVQFTDVQGPDTAPQPTGFNEYYEEIVVPDTDLGDRVMNELPEPEHGKMWHSNERTEAMDEDEFSSLFGSVRNTPEPEGPNDWDTTGGSRDIASRALEGGFAHDVGADCRHETEIDDDRARTSTKALQNDQMSTNDRAESESERVGQSLHSVASVQEGEIWRLKNGFANVQDSGIAGRTALLLPNIATNPALLQGADEVFDGLRSAPITGIKESNELLKGIHGTLARILDIQLRESIENAKFREFVMTSQGQTPS